MRTLINKNRIIEVKIIDNGVAISYSVMKSDNEMQLNQIAKKFDSQDELSEFINELNGKNRFIQL